MAKPNQHEINRILIGNQIHIMRMISLTHLRLFGSAGQQSITDIKIHNIKSWWWQKFEEEVGFDSAYDSPPEKL